MGATEAPGAKKAAEIGTKAVAAAVGATVAGPGGAIAAVALEPLMLGLLQRSWDELGELRRKSAGLMVGEAATKAGVTPEELIERAWRNDETTQLFADAFYQAAQTFNMKKVRALARALANGLADDDARPDHEQLIVAAVADMDEAHIKVLARLPAFRRNRSVSTIGVKNRTVATRGMRVDAIAEVANLSLSAAQHVAATLVRIGAAATDDSAADIRFDRLILELQSEVTELNKKLADSIAGKRVKTGSKRISKPGRHPEVGYGRTPFGSECLAYLLDIEQEAAEAVGGEVVEDGLAEME